MSEPKVHHVVMEVLKTWTDEHGRECQTLYEHGVWRDRDDADKQTKDLKKKNPKGKFFIAEQTAA